jgi:hypothetical protein
MWPIGVQEVKAPRFLEGGKVVTPTQPAAFTPGISWYSFLEAHGLVGSFGKKKSPVTRPGFDPGTSRLVALPLRNRRPLPQEYPGTHF